MSHTHKNRHVLPSPLGCLFIATFMLLGLVAEAQYYISGPTSVTQGQTYTYTIENLGGSYSGVSWYSPYGGVVTSAYGNVANVRWDYAGSSILMVGFYVNGNYYNIQSPSVTVTGTAPANPPNPTVSDASPGSVTLLRTGTPPTGVTWYWQESASGTSTANGSSATKTVTSGSMYYLRAYNGTTWSPGSGSVPYTIPTTPSNENYIYSVTPRKAVTTIGSLANNERVEGFTYFDGLGRPMQGVGVRAGGNNEDILTHIEYDQYGRQDKEYLPYSSASSIGLYRSTALSATKVFYDQTKYDADFPGMTTSNINPFVEKSLEPSPLGRILEQGAPGMDWLVNKTSNSDHTVKFEYKTNASGEVRYYGAGLSYANNTYTPTLTGGGGNNYGAGTLTKTITKDENWTSGTDRTTEEFKDKEGRVVLVRKYNGGEKHDTYHVYNNHGTLSYVLPPKVDAGNTSLSLATIASRLDELAYQYRYDNRKRIVEKKSPGKEWEYIVYDKLDRPVLIQDGNQRVPSTDEWLFTKYDIFGRVIYTGTYDSNSSRTSLQSTFDAKTAAQNYESKATSGTGYDSTYYTNNNFPNTNIEVLAVSYYDDYTFGGFSAMPYNVEGQLVLNYNNDVSTRKHTKGLATGTKVKILDTSTWTTTYMGYDGKGRSIYSKSVNNYLGTTDIVQNKLDFTGAVEKTLATHSRTGGHGTITTEDLFTYDHMGRLKKQTQEINDNNVLEVIAENTFDDLGQLKEKKVGGKSTENRLQDVDYTYNVRGWLKGINNESGSNSSITLGSGDLFGFQINHNNPSIGGTALFNGNISQTLWKTTSVNPSPYYAVSNKYTYTYDALNRLLTATDNTGHYNVSNLAYDKNGNIMSLTRYGWKGSADFNNMDVLDYDYFGSEISNKLYKVRDDGSDTYGYKDSGVDDQDYWYDVNGNLTKDDNKGITSITYYHFNLPKRVTFSGTNKYIDYIYDANGVKIKRTVNDNTVDTETFYAGNYIYEDSSLKFFNQPEGYIVKSGSNFEYIYQYKDHLGNIRLSYKDVNRNNVSASSLQIQEENNYYPFGLKHEGYNNAPFTNHPYKYNGVELNTGLGLNLYEMDVRSYDPAIARFTSLDPVTRFEFSPYSAFDNNPVFWADPSGATPETTYFGAVDFMGRSRKDRWGDYIPPNARVAGSETSWFSTDSGAFADMKVSEMCDDCKSDKDKNGKGNGKNGNDDDKDNKDNGNNSTATNNTNNVLVIAGIYANLLEKYAIENKSLVYIYGTAEISATQLTSDNIARMSKIAKGAWWFGTVGNSLSIGLSGYEVYQHGWNLERGGDILFGTIGYFGTPGLIINLSYMGAKEYSKGIQKKIEESSDGGARVIRAMEIQTMINCFAEGSKVLMSDGTLKNIELVKVGDMVLTYNFDDTSFEKNTVLKIDNPIHHKLIKLIFSNGEEIVSTEDHPYYVDNKGWCSFNPEQTFKNYGIETKQLEPLDYCLEVKKEKLKKIKVMRIVPFEKSIRTFNLTEISDSDNYFVNGILVNNETKTFKNQSE